VKQVTSSRKKPRPGDLLELETPRGLAYVQYTGKHPKYGGAIRVFPGLFFETRPQDWNSLLSHESYFTFYPVGAAAWHGLVKIVANLPLPPEGLFPARFRRSGWITKEGKVTLWFICEGDQETRRTELSAEEKKLSIASIWNHEFLIDSLVEEWRPEQEY
jgi:hypothetical protein